MNLEVYDKPVSKEVLDERFAEFFFSFIDLCNSYKIDLSSVSAKRINELAEKIEKWEEDNEGVLSRKRKKLD